MTLAEGASADEIREKLIHFITTHFSHALPKSRSAFVENLPSKMHEEENHTVLI